MASWADRMRNGRSNTDRPTADPGTLRPDGVGVPQPIPPIEEHPPAPVNPYRGMEMHGATAQESHGVDVAIPLGADEWDGPKWTAPTPDIEPVLVKVVTESSDEYRAWRATQFVVPAGTGVQQLLGRDRSRKIVRMNVVVGSPVLIGHNTGLTTTNGYFVQPGGAVVSIDSTEPIFVLSFDGGTATMNILQEYVVNPLGQHTGFHREQNHRDR